MNDALGITLQHVEQVMTSFANVWILKSSLEVAPGTPMEVSLKSGKTKTVVVDKYIGKQGEYHLYLPATK